ncbi:MAG: helicase-related protein [Polyangiales bacterium]
MFVDEQVYRDFRRLVATVDKFAMVPWRAEAGMLFGRVHSREGARFFRHARRRDSAAERRGAADGLRPPELIVQDELHLISGPLGTMVGLYETAIEALCETKLADGTRVRPKLLASTATVRRARRQILSLFGRDAVALFPPPGIEEGNTFFARVDREADGRLYLGVAAGGRALKAVLLRVYVTLLTATWHEVREPSSDDAPADPYTTVVGYFNALRELGGMRRLVEDEVRSRCARISDRGTEDGRGGARWFRTRELGEPVELTSRESTGSIARTRARLKLPHTHDEHVDVLLASNMISVGVDIDRLGVMVVAGQPKTTSEYIQATSRVGRQAKWPGLVVTALALHKPRDRSHYERFTPWHESFYRHVEASSLTPFSAPALERGFAGALLAMARHGDGSLQPSDGVMDVEAHRTALNQAIETFATRAGRERLGLDARAHEALVETLRQRGQSLVDSWVALVRASREGAASRCWSPYDKDRKGKPMLFTVLDAEAPPTGTDDARFAAPTSMRDVEPTAHIWVERRKLSRKEVSR